MAVFYNVMFYGGLTLAIIFAIAAIVIFFVMKIPAAIGDVTGSTAKKKIEEIREKGYESVQGVGVAKKDAIKSTSTKISVRDVQSSSSRQAEKGRENYEKAVADINRRKQQGDYLRENSKDVYSEDSTEMPTDVLQENIRTAHEDNTQHRTFGYEEATDVLRDDEEATDVLRENLTDEEFEQATDVLTSDEYDGATDVLRDDFEEATDVLRSDDDEATDVLRGDEEATDVLRSDDDEATDVLRSDDDEATDVLRGYDSTASEDIRSMDGYDREQAAGKRKSSVTMVKDVVVVHSDEQI